jgi:hypothetical protein
MVGVMGRAPKSTLLPCVNPTSAVDPECSEGGRKGTRIGWSSGRQLFAHLSEPGDVNSQGALLIDTHGCNPHILLVRFLFTYQFIFGSTGN